MLFLRPTLALLVITVALAATPAGRATAGSEAEPSSGLPPIACLEAIRAARIAGERGDAAAARERLEAALATPGCELPALSDLLRMLREDPGAGERVAELRGRLSGLLAEPAHRLPPGLLSQLARIGWTHRDPDSDSLLLDALARRRAAAAAKGVELPRDERVETLQVTATLQRRLGRGELARQALDALLELEPSDAVRWEALLYDLQNDRWASAVELLAPLAAKPESPEIVRYYLVSALAHLGRYDEVLRELDRLAPPAGAPAPSVPTALPSGVEPNRGGGDFVALLIEAAWGLRDAGRDADAAALFRRVLTYDAENASAHAALLHLYGTEEERAAAARATAERRETETDPQRLFEEGTDLLSAGDAAGAMALLARAAPGLGGSDYAEPAWYNLGNAAVHLERWGEAERAFEQAIAVNPERVDSHFKRGVALHRLDRCAEAVPLLRRTLELQPDKRDAHYYLGACHAKLGDSAAAAREMALFNAGR